MNCGFKYPFEYILQGLVVCKQLGYLRVSEVTTGSQFGSVSDDFSYDDVQCFGFESNLDNCAHSNTDNCRSNEGAGVVCTNDPGKYRVCYEFLVTK